VPHLERAHEGRTSTIAGVVALCVALIAGLGSVFAAPAASETTRPAVTVSQSTGLVNQRVLVRWTGFSAAAGTNSVIVMQCKGASPTARDCWAPRRLDDNGVTHMPDTGKATKQSGLPTAADGSGQAWLQIRPSLRLPELGCGDKQACSVLVFVQPTHTSTVDAFKADDKIPIGESVHPMDTDIALALATGNAASAPLSFAPTPDACPGMEHPDLALNGASEFTAAGSSWVFGLCTAAGNPVDVTVSAGSGPSGRETYLAGGIDVGITQQPIGGPLDRARPAPLTGERAKGTVYAPLTNGAIVVAFNMDDSATRLPITSMKLTPRLVAKLITGAYRVAGSPLINSLWTDPEFTAINDTATWPAGYHRSIVMRGVQDDTIWALTSWLASDPATLAWLGGTPDEHGIVCPADWRVDKVAYPFPVYTNRLPVLNDLNVPQSVYEDIANRLGNAQPMDRQSTELGPVEVSPDKYGRHNVMAVTTAEAAARMGVPVARLRNAAGAFVDPYDPAAIRAGLAAAKPAGPDGVTLLNDFATRDAAAYPLTLTDVAMIPTHHLTAEKAARIDTFLAYAAGPGQIQGAQYTIGELPRGYTPLSAAQRQQIAAARKVIADTPKWTGATPTPTPTPTPTATPSPNDPPPGTANTGGGTGGAAGGGPTGGGGTPQPSANGPKATPTPSPSTSTAPVAAAAPTGGPDAFPSVADVVADALKGHPSAILVLVLLLVSAGAALAGPVLLVLGHRRRTGSWPAAITAALHAGRRLLHRREAAA